MGLDIGIIRITYLDRPRGITYDFAWEMAQEASVSGYMHGEGNNWAGFTQRQVLGLLEDFANRRNLPDLVKADILAWLRSLPWDAWDDDLDISVAQDDDHDAMMDGPNEQDGGLIELHFNW
ncbi:MAG: hypothetical protein HY685_03910, partial [Chloroflexi bacterium]|nr:hypothetical protein [Chloroflexota bacterium]